MFDENGNMLCDCYIFVPPNPIKKGLYLCDKQFHVQPVLELFIDNNQRFGLIKINGNGYTISNIIATSNSITMKVLEKESTKLQKGHSRGGQSQNRISRLHDESHFNYITKTLETLNNVFIDAETSQPNINGLIIAGNAAKKDDLYGRLDARLNSITLGVLTIDNSNEGLQDECLKLIDDWRNSKDKKILDELLTNITEDYIVYGQVETTKNFRMKLLKKIIIHHSIFENHSHQQQQKLEERCEIVGTELIIIKIDTESSQLFLDGYGGFAGIKWY